MGGGYFTVLQSQFINLGFTFVLFPELNDFSSAVRDGGQNLQHGAAVREFRGNHRINIYIPESGDSFRFTRKWAF
jgi:hypothetical protein